MHSGGEALHCLLRGYPKNVFQGACHRMTLALLGRFAGANDLKRLSDGLDRDRVL